MKTNELASNVLALAQHMGRSTDVDTLEKASDALEVLSDIAAVIDNEDGVLSPFDSKPELLERLRAVTR